MSSRWLSLPVAVVVVFAAVCGGHDALAAKARKKKPPAVVVAGPATVAILASDKAAPLQAKIEEGLLSNNDVKRVVWAIGFVADATLARQMKDQKADIFVRVERRAGAAFADAIVISAFGADGKPRFFSEFAASDDTSNVARVVDAVAAILQGFGDRKVITLPTSSGGTTTATTTPSPPKTTPSTTTTPSETTTTSTATTPTETPLPTVPAGPRTLWHLAAVSTWFDGGTWSYGLDGPGTLDQNVGSALFPGVGVRLDLWPVSFFGIDAQARYSALDFVVQNADELQLDPGAISTSHIEAGVFLKARYLLELDGFGIGFGGRVGYRTWLASTVPQTVPGLDAETRVPVTIVPGFDLQALAVGGEVFVPILVGGRRLEIDLRAEALPLMAYSEKPDAPGDGQGFVGFSGALDVRLDLVAGVFVEVGAATTGTTLAFDGAGDRQRISPDTGLPEALAGGSGLNLTASFHTGLGFMY